MTIIYEPEFIKSFNTIWDFISFDSNIRANKFKTELQEKIETLYYMPYKFRKSIYFKDEDIRDLIFKGYIIPYKIDTSKNQIIIIGINKYQSYI